MHVSDQGGLLRARDGGEQRVTPLELFFDLVFVFAVTQLSHLLLEHLTLSGALETLLLLLAMWWAWIYTAWFTNWFDPDRLRGAPAAGRSDARQPAHVGRDPGGLRGPRADVRLGLRGHPGGAHRVRVASPSKVLGPLIR